MNKYEELFCDWLDLTEFRLVKHNNNYNPDTGEYGYYSLIDLQGANLGNIEGDRFDTAEQIIERMSGVYLDDYILLDLKEMFPKADVEYSIGMTVCEEWLAFARENQNCYDEAKFEFDLLDLFVNHYNDINLENLMVDIYGNK